MWFIIVISILISIANVNTLVPIGANMHGLADWSRSLPYVNLVRQARVWRSLSAPWDANATTDSMTGWPISDFGMALATDNIDMGGKYLFYAKGNASITTFDGAPASKNPTI
jgi:hypothetical protein